MVEPGGPAGRRRSHRSHLGIVGQAPAAGPDARSRHPHRPPRRVRRLSQSDARRKDRARPPLRYRLHRRRACQRLPGRDRDAAPNTAPPRSSNCGNCPTRCPTTTTPSRCTRTCSPCGPGCAATRCAGCRMSRRRFLPTSSTRIEFDQPVDVLQASDARQGARDSGLQAERRFSGGRSSDTRRRRAVREATAPRSAAHHRDRTARVSAPWSLESFKRELILPFSRIMVVDQVPAEPGGQIAGFLCRWLIVDECHILNLAVHPDTSARGNRQGADGGSDNRSQSERYPAW